MSAPMVRAILTNRKTQTRRVIMPQPDIMYEGYPYRHAPDKPEGHDIEWHKRIDCPYGKIGDRLWVREKIYHGSFSKLPTISPSVKTWAEFPHGVLEAYDAWYAADHDPNDAVYRTTPSIHMPRWASRLTLEITDIRVEQVQDITEDDALAEGSHEWLNSHQGRAYDNACEAACRWTKRLNRPAGVCSHRGEFAAFWDSINGKKPGATWTDNPWVWALSFRVVT